MPPSPPPATLRQLIAFADNHQQISWVREFDTTLLGPIRRFAEEHQIQIAIDRLSEPPEADAPKRHTRTSRQASLSQPDHPVDWVFDRAAVRAAIQTVTDWIHTQNRPQTPASDPDPPAPADSQDSHPAGPQLRRSQSFSVPGAYPNQSPRQDHPRFLPHTPRQARPDFPTASNLFAPRKEYTTYDPLTEYALTEGLGKQPYRQPTFPAKQTAPAKTNKQEVRARTLSSSLSSSLSSGTSPQPPSPKPSQDKGKGPQTEGSSPVRTPESTRMSNNGSGSGSGSGSGTGGPADGPGGNDDVARLAAATFAAFQGLVNSPDNNLGKALAAIAESAQAFGRAQNFNNNAVRWDIEKVGCFYPNAEDSHGKGDFFTVGSRLHWRNVFAFTDSVRDHTIASPERQAMIAQCFLQLLKGDAQAWYHQLDRDVKDAMALDLDISLTTIEERFKINEAEALARLEATTYSQSDVQNDKDYRTWALETIRLCKAYGLTTPIQQMTQLYHKTYPGLRQLIVRPATNLRLDEWLKHVEEKQKVHKSSLDHQASGGGSLNDLLVHGKIPNAQQPTIEAPPTQKLLANGVFSSEEEQHDYNEQQEEGDINWSNTRNFSNSNFGRQNYGRSFGEGNSFRPRGQGSFRGQNSYRPRGFDEYRRGGFRGRGRGRGFANRGFGGRGSRQGYRRWIKPRWTGQAYNGVDEERLLNTEREDLEEAEAKLKAEGFCLLDVDESEDNYVLADDNETEYIYTVPHAGDPATNAPAANEQLAKDKAKRTCRKCNAVFPTRSLCFQHVYANSCTQPKPKGFAPLDKDPHQSDDGDSDQAAGQSGNATKRQDNGAIQQSRRLLVEENYFSMDDLTRGDPQMRHALASLDRITPAIGATPEKPHIARYAYTYMIANTPNGLTTVCIDSGASHQMVGKEWLEKFFPNYTLHTDQSMTVTGVGGQVTMTERVTIQFQTIAYDARGNPKLVELEADAWVSPELKPNLLLGTPWLHAYGARIDFAKKTISLADCGLLSVPVEYTRKPRPTSRRVVASSNVMIPARSAAPVQVLYKDLPQEPGRDFLFVASHEGALNALVAAETPHVVMVVNNADHPITIKRKTRLGKIEDIQSDGWCTTTWEKGNIAQTAAAVQTAALDDADEASWLSDEIDISDDTLAQLADDSKTLQDIWNTTIKNGADPFRKLPSLGVTKPEEVPSIVTEEGVHICNVDPKWAKKFQALVEEFPDLWVDRGIIDLPDEEKMRFHLAEGWQNQRTAAKTYQVGLRERADMDAILDKMHIPVGRNGPRLDWQKLPTPFAHPAFMVYRVAEGKKKGRLVIDMRNFNKILLGDAYPLPSQDAMIAKTRGRKCFSMMDASGFFHQLPVHPDDRHMMTIISPRGLEVSNVVLMGCKTAPAYAQRFMDRLLADHRQYADAFIDDIQTSSHTPREHLAHVRNVFKAFQNAGVSLSPTKTWLFFNSIKVLGLLVDGFGVATTEERVEAIRKIAMPTTLDTLENYIGLTGYLQQFIPMYSQKIQPLQDKKTTLLAQGRKEGKVFKTKSGRKKWAARTKFQPTGQERESFGILQDQLCDTAYLIHWNPNAVTFVKLDASKERGFGVMIFHLAKPWDNRTLLAEDIQPIMYLSKILTPGERGYGATELEVACLVWACRTKRVQFQSCYAPIIVFTDHQATRGVVQQTNLRSVDAVKNNLKLMAASTYLSQFDLDIRYIPGRVNLVPDALSRLPTVHNDEDEHMAENSQAAELEDITKNFGYYAVSHLEIDPEFRAKIVHGYTKDEKWARLIQGMAEAQQRLDNLREGREKALKQKRKARPKVPAKMNYRHELEDGLLYHVLPDGHKKLCIPSNCVDDLLSIVHDDTHHFGPKRMYQQLANFTIHGLHRKVERYVASCPACLQNKTDRGQKLGHLQPINTPTIPFDTIAWDFIVALPEVPTEGSLWCLPKFKVFDACLTVTCKFARRRLLIPGSTRMQATDWAEQIIKGLLFADWGCPRQIISDRDPKFTSAFWEMLWLRHGTKVAMTTSWHPQADGQSERTNQDVEIALRYHIEAFPDVPWDRMLLALQHNINNSKSEALGRSPNEMVFGFKPNSMLSALEIPKRDVDYEVMRKMHQTEAKAAMDFAADIAKIRVDKTRNPVVFDVGDEVYLRLHKGYKLPGNPPRKWSSQRAGPFTVTRRIGDLAYELNFPRTWKAHRVVSVEQLFPMPEEGDPAGRRRKPLPGRIVVEGDDSEWHSYEIERLVQRRVNKEQGRPTLEYLVRWKDYPPAYDQWYPRDHLMENAAALVDDFDKKHKMDPNELKARGDAPKPATEIAIEPEWRMVEQIPRTNIQVQLPARRAIMPSK